jgi:hypothetical protein
MTCYRRQPTYGREVIDGRDRRGRVDGASGGEVATPEVRGMEGRTVCIVSAAMAAVQSVRIGATDAA